MEQLRVEMNKDVSRILLRGVPDRPGIAAEIFGELGTRGFNVEMVVTTGGTRGTADICLAVTQSQQSAVREALQHGPGAIIAADIAVDNQVALVSIVGPSLAKVPGVAGRTFKALSGRGINIDVISTSLVSVTCLIARDRAEEAVAALEGEFLSEKT
jgi:aspartate kinase